MYKSPKFPQNLYDLATQMDVAMLAERVRTLEDKLRKCGNPYTPPGVTKASLLPSLKPSRSGVFSIGNSPSSKTLAELAAALPSGTGDCNPALHIETAVQLANRLLAEKKVWLVFSTCPRI